MANNLDYRYHVMSRHGLEPDLCSSTRHEACVAAESLPPEDWPITVFDTMAHAGRASTWNLLPNCRWEVTAHA